MIANFKEIVQAIKRSFFSLRAHGSAVASAKIACLFVFEAPSSLRFGRTGKKICGRSPSWRAKRKGDWGKEFLTARSVPQSGTGGWEAARPCVSRGAKSAKIDSLTKKILCARPS